MTQTLTYTLYTNLDARFGRGYHRGDRLVKGWTGTVPATDGPYYNLEGIFAIHNRDDRPDGQLAPSMSVGDVVILGETAFTVAAVGFVGVALDPADLITDRTWSEMVF